MIPDRIEYLLMLARDERTENDALIDKQNEIFTARALRLLQLQELHEETGRILQEELKRFNRWMPKSTHGHQAQGGFAPLGSPKDVQERMPKVVSHGPIKG